MNKSAIKKYAVWARRELIDRVAKKAVYFGVSAEGNPDPKADAVDGRLLSDTEKKQRAALIAKIEAHGYEQTIEEVAYTWFNRFAALRFMEVNRYLPSHVRVFTNDVGEFKPQILAEAIHLELPGLDKEKVYALKESNDDEALFRYLIVVQCNALNEILPGMFQRIGDDTELLLPDNLLREGSVIERLIAEIPEEDWRDQVQIIGWLYQYYNTEPKDKVFADLKKNIKVTKEKIPAATQLFTPDWIVRYMVENSLGRLWLEGHPNEKLQSEWKYYLPEAEQEEEVQKQLAEIRKEYANIKPTDIRCIDPCMGSGHILCYLFDVLMQIYQDYGHTPHEAVASILENNLYGLDIDDRAAQLAYFAVMMKARQYDRRFFSRHLQPNVMAIQESNGLRTWSEVAGDSLVSGQLTFDDNYIRMADYLIKTFHDAKEYGSILTVEPDNYDDLLGFIGRMKQEVGNLLFKAWIEEIEKRIVPLICQAKWLSIKYDVVVTNPPYMSSGGMNDTLLKHVRGNFVKGKTDLFAIFIMCCMNLTKKNGYLSMITMQSWMFLSTFSNLRNFVLDFNITNLIRIGYNSFPDLNSQVAHACSFVINKICLPKYNGKFFDLNTGHVTDDKALVFLNYIKNDKYFVRSRASFNCIPNKPIAFSLPTSILKLFSNECTLNKFGITRLGMTTANNEKFTRFWHEVDIDSCIFNASNEAEVLTFCKKWVSYNKGGKFRKWYGNLDVVVNWENSGYEIKNYADCEGNIRSTVPNTEFYFRECVTWSKISTDTLAFRYRPNGSIFDVAGACLFSNKHLYELLAVCNSCVAIKILNTLSPTLNFEGGQISLLPIAENVLDNLRVCDLSRQNVNLSKIDWDTFEISWDFARHPIVQKALIRDRCDITIENAYLLVVQDFEERFAKLKANEEELNHIFIDIYGLQDELTSKVADKDVTVARIYDTKEIIPDSMRGNNYVLTKQDVVKSLISYAVGCMMGRYSLDVGGLAYAGGKWDNTKYKTFQPDSDAILPICDDEYFDDDIVGRFVEFVEVVFGKDTLEENLQFIADTLGDRGTPREVIRNYFLTGFYADHVKTYQKRPIYWLFDSGKKNGFKCLVYMHRYRPDTIARIRTDYIHEQQSRYRTAMETLERGRDNAATAAEKVKLGKKLAAIEAQAKELQEYEEKIHHLADQMIAIDLDDGVKHNYALFKDVLAKIK